MQKLNLFNPLTYKREEFTFNSLIKKILLSPKGSDSFILYGAARFGGKLGAVVPHVLGHDTAVIGHEAVLFRDEILRMQWRADHEDVLERNLPYNEQGRYIQGGK